MGVRLGSVALNMDVFFHGLLLVLRLYRGDKPAAVFKNAERTFLCIASNRVKYEVYIPEVIFELFFFIIDHFISAKAFQEIKIFLAAVPIT